MKKTLLSLLLFIVATTMSGQTMLRGDMNNDGKLTLTDVNALLDVLIGKAPIEAISVYEVDNTTVIGTWYAEDGTMLIFREDGTTNYPGGATYEFMPVLGRLLVYDATGGVIKTMILTKVTPEYLLEENAVNGALTYYTNAAYVVADITLNRSSLSLNSGTTFLLQAATAPATALSNYVAWSSSDESVATVNDNGLVTAVASGTCTITCTAKDGGGASASCTVTVVQMVTSITLSHTTLVLQPDGYQKLTATVLPTNANNRGVTWTSSDESVAEVTSNGGVAAIGLGTCTITCTAKDGSGVSATCVVDVSEDTDTHAYVDLGLPSGTLWATCNIGADNPEEYGDYFAWGEITPKTIYDWSTYKYCNGSKTTMTKYCTDNSYGIVDNITELELYDDAAYVNWGSEWRMPSYEQFQELYDSNYTSTTWTTLNDVRGRLFTSKSNNNSLFLPATGFYFNTSLVNAGVDGYYWSFMLDTSQSISACHLNTSLENVYWYYGDRCCGNSIRPVRNTVGN